MMINAKIVQVIVIVLGVIKSGHILDIGEPRITQVK